MQKTKVSKRAMMARIRRRLGPRKYLKITTKHMKKLGARHNYHAIDLDTLEVHYFDIKVLAKLLKVLKPWEEVE